MLDLGVVRPGSTIRIPFSSFDKDDGSSITMTNFAVGDILIYKDGSTTERASTAGYTATTDFDSKTGKHLAIIDLADNTTAGFYSAGSEYLVGIDAVTVDTVTVGAWIARFVIGYADAILNTTIATLSSQTSFTLTAGPAEDDALNNCQIVIHDVASAVQVGRAVISDYTGSTKTVTLAAGTTFTAAASDNVSVLGLAPLIPTVAGRPLDVSAAGNAGIDWSNVEAPTTTLALTGTTIATTQKVDVETIKTNPVVNGGTITFPTGATLASTTNITAGTITTATNVTTVNGLAAGVITAASIATGAIDADALATDAVTEIWAGSTAPSAATIADAVWDEDATAHQTQGTFGQAIGDPGADTDTIWALANTNLDAAISSRMATYTQPTGFLAATFPTTVASTTNITAGTITTATNVTTVNGLAAGVITASSIASDAITAAKIADGAIDRATFAADTGLQTVRSNTAQAGGASSITLDASASSVNNFYRGMLIELTGGTGVGQGEVCASYNGTTKVATMYKAWVSTSPDNTTTFAIKGYYHGVDTSLYSAADIGAIGGVSGSNVSGLSSLGTAYGAGTLTTNITGNVTGNLSGSVGSVTGAVGSVTGAVGSVTGNVGGNVVGSVASVTGNVGGNVVGSVASVAGNVGGNVVGSVASVTAAVAITSNIKKNQALSGFEFLMTDSTTHAPATGLTVTVTRSIDGAAFAAGTLSSVSEVGNGVYSVNFGAGDLNGNVITLKATATGADACFERIVTQP